MVSSLFPAAFQTNLFKRFQKIMLLFAIVFSGFKLSAQSTQVREFDRNEIGWVAVVGSMRFTERWGMHNEYQWRRVGFGKFWQQSLIRTGLNYHLNPNALFRVGYGHIETFPYAEFTINPYGKHFTEHRAFQMFQLSQSLGKTTFTHRYLLEQRWLGSYSDMTLKKEDLWNYVNRLRYMVRFQFPLYSTPSVSGKIYGLVYDEVMIGFGKNVRENVFDQNRIGLQLGFVINPQLKVEAGYFNQILQLGREVNGLNVFQQNSGFLVNFTHAIDFRNKTE